MRCALFCFFYVLSGSVALAGTQEVIESDFENNGGSQNFKYDPWNLNNGIDYFSESVRGIRHYNNHVEGECGRLQFYQLYISNKQMILDGSCEGQGSQFHQYIYRWDKKYNNWCLRKEVFGERADRTSGSDQKLQAETISGCIPLGSGPN